jgi:flavodoxin
MKASILIFSQTGNTLKVSASISKSLGICGVEVDQVSFLHRTKWKPDNTDLIGIGCPVFENRPAEIVPHYLADSGFNFAGKKGLCFHYLRRLTCQIIVASVANCNKNWSFSTRRYSIKRVQFIPPPFFGLFPKRQNEKELERAEKFGRAVAANII